MSRRLSAPQGLGWVRESGVQPVQVMILCIPFFPESNLKFSLFVTEEVINEERERIRYYFTNSQEAEGLGSLVTTG